MKITDARFANALYQYVITSATPQHYCMQLLRAIASCSASHSPCMDLIFPKSGRIATPLQRGRGAQVAIFQKKMLGDVQFRNSSTTKVEEQEFNKCRTSSELYLYSLLQYCTIVVSFCSTSSPGLKELMVNVQLAICTCIRKTSFSLIYTFIIC